jgi:hypothetical protein
VTTVDPWQEIKRSWRVLAITNAAGDYEELEIDPDRIYTVIPAGGRMTHPRGQTWWTPPHNHLRRGVEVVVWQSALCPICRARAAGVPGA